MARDRLLGTNPWASGDARVFDLLGRVHRAMNDEPAAGLAWFLSDRQSDDPEAAEAIATMRQRYADAVAAALGLDLRAQVRRFSPAAQERLQALRREVVAAGGRWEPPGVPQGPRRPSRGEPAPPSRRQPEDGRWEGVLLGAGALTLLGVFVVGVVQTVRRLVGLAGLLF